MAEPTQVVTPKSITLAEFYTRMPFSTQQGQSCIKAEDTQYCLQGDEDNTYVVNMTSGKPISAAFPLNPSARFFYSKPDDSVWGRFYVEQWNSGRPESALLIDLDEQQDFSNMWRDLQQIDVPYDFDSSPNACHGTDWGNVAYDPGGQLKSGQSWPLQNRPVAGLVFG